MSCTNRAGWPTGCHWWNDAPATYLVEMHHEHGTPTQEAYCRKHYGRFRKAYKGKWHLVAIRRSGGWQLAKGLQ